MYNLKRNIKVEITDKRFF